MQPDDHLFEAEQAVLNAIPAAAAIIDDKGDLLGKNPNWTSEKKNINWLGVRSYKRNIFTQCQKAIDRGNDYALRLMINIREAFEDPDKSAQMTVSTIKKGEKKWFKISITVLRGEYNRVLIICDDVSANMKTIQALRESEERYSQHFQYSVSGIILGTIDGEVISANPAACQILGYSKEELINGGRKLIVNENDPAHLEMIQVRNEHSYFEGEKEYIHKDGHLIPVEIISVVFRNHLDELQVINTFRDKSLEKRVQFSLDEERRFARTAINSIPGIFFVIDSDMQLVRWNNTIEYKLGYVDEELLSMKIGNLFHCDDYEKALHNFKKIFKTGNGDFTIRVRSKHGEEYTYHLYVNRFANKNVDFLVTTGVDITGLLKAEKEKSENYALMTQLFENSPLATVMIDHDDRVVKVNNSFISLFGYSKAEILGRNVNKLVATEEQRDEAIKVSREAFKGKTNQQETIRVNKKGKKVPVLISTVPIRNNNTVIAVYGIYVDLTDQKKLESQLQRSLNEKDVLLQEVHHRVKNNLAIIAGLLELQIIHLNGNENSSHLKETLSRVFSISKIHETLYQEEDVVRVRFDKYLDMIIESLPEKSGKNNVQIRKKKDSHPLLLNINQAVPLGLLINEMINLGSSNNTIGKSVAITLTKEGETINLQIDGISPDADLLKSGLVPDTFHKLLIKTFLDQINATIKLVEDQTNKINIQFTKSDNMRGSSSAITNQENLIKKIVIEN